MDYDSGSTRYTGRSNGFDCRHCHLCSPHRGNCTPANQPLKEVRCAVDLLDRWKVRRPPLPRHFQSLQLTQNAYSAIICAILNIYFRERLLKSTDGLWDGVAGYICSYVSHPLSYISLLPDLYLKTLRDFAGHHKRLHALSCLRLPPQRLRVSSHPPSIATLWLQTVPFEAVHLEAVPLLRQQTHNTPRLWGCGCRGAYPESIEDADSL